MYIEPTTPADHLDLFSAFQCILSSLSLSRVSIAWSFLAALGGYFPNLRHLSLSATLLEMHNQPAPPVIYTLCGKLPVDRIIKEFMHVADDRLARLEPEYKGVEILGMYDHCLVTAVERSLEPLMNDNPMRGYVGPVHTSRCVPHGAGLPTFFLQQNPRMVRPAVLNSTS